MTNAALVGLLATTAKKSSSSSAGFLIVILILGVLAYFFLLRPQQQKARKQRAQQSDISVGDEVLTIGGIVGTVLDIENDRVTIITGVEDGDEGGAPGRPTRLILIRSAIARKVEPVVNEPDAEEDGSPDAELHYADEHEAEDADEGDGERRTDGGSGEGKGP